MNPEKKFLFAMTHFDDDPDRAAVPLVLACNALAGGAEDVMLWTTAQGVKIAKKGEADKIPNVSFPPFSELLETFLEAGGQVGVCPPCAKTHGVTEETKIEQATWIGGSALIEVMQGRETAWF